MSKAFDGVAALAGVDLDVQPGEIHALCGENGAGKSTLIRVLAGSCRPDAGQVLIGSQRLTLGSVAASETAGIAVIHQEPVAFPHLSAAENIFVGREPRRLGGLWLDRRTMRQRTLNLLRQLGEGFDPGVPTGELTLAQRQMVAIARALSCDCRLFILDEPTASLSARETEALFRIIGQLQAAGVSVLYVSHRLEEVFRLANRVSVLRDGHAVGTRAIREIDRAGLIQMMVGRELGVMARPGPPSRSPGPALLDVEGLTRAGAFYDVSFQLRAGEVVGFAGLVGAGRSEVARAIFGVDPYERGTVSLPGRRLAPGSVRAALGLGLALVPEDRQRLGLVMEMSVSANITLAILRSLARAGLRSPRRECEVASRMIRELGIKVPGVHAEAKTLSGGNQQKLLLGKWLAAAPRVLLLDEPTRGVDVGAKAEVHRLVRRLAEQGMATMLISSDLPEVLALSDRILVMRAGRIVGELCGAEATQERVMSLAIPVGTTDPLAASPAAEAHA